MMVAGRLPVLKSCISCWLTPFVPWQLAQAAARLRPRLGSVPCARAGTARTAPEASAAASSGRIIVGSSKDFFLAFEFPSGPPGCQGAQPEKKAASGGLFSLDKKTAVFVEPTP